MKSVKIKTKNFINFLCVVGIFFAVIIILTATTDKTTKRKAINTDNLEAGWKLYTNKRYGFKLEYPREWNLWQENYDGPRQDVHRAASFEYNPSEIVYLGPGDIGVHIDVISTTNSLEKWFKENEELTETKKKINVDAMQQYANDPTTALKLADITSNYTSTSISGLPAILQNIEYKKPQYIEGGPYTYKEYYVKKDNQIFHVYAKTPTAPQAADVLKTFDKLVMSFTFN